MEEIQLKENISNKEIDINSKKGTKPNRHVSVLYGVQFMTRVPMVKRCRKTQYECFVNINKKDIFISLHKFVERLMGSQEFFKEVIEELNFHDNEVSTTLINKPKEKPNNTKKCSILGQNLLNKLGLGENQFHNIRQQKNIGEDLQDNNFLKVSNNQKSMKACKISIMMDEGFGFSDSSDKIGSSCSSALFSDESISSGISSINIVQQQFSLNIVQKIYEQPEPFLINLSVCLMLKFLNQSMRTLNKSNVCWILSVATIVAYKIFYDEPVEGLVDSFAHILKIKRDQIITLQRLFLAAINHQAVISNQQYHSVLYQIIKHGTN